MSKSYTEEKVCNLIAEILRLDKEEVELDSDIYHDLGADSLDDVVEIVIEVEEEFNVQIPDSFVADNFKTPKDIINFINKNTNDERSNL